MRFLLIAFTGASLWAQPAVSRGEQSLPVPYDECIRRARNALPAEGYSIPGYNGTSFVQAFKEIHSVYIMCNPGPDGRTWANIVVASSTQDANVPGAERVRLQQQMERPSGGNVTSTGGGPVGQVPVSTENVALNKPARQSSLSEWSTQNDSQGGVDGVKNGRYGFHTKQEPNPWWEVDLQQVVPLGEITVYNRTDFGPERARTLQVLVTEDGRNWRTIYTHNGSTFGASPTSPLRIPAGGVRARWVRLQLRETTYFHLDEVEIRLAR